MKSHSDREHLNNVPARMKDAEIAFWSRRRKRVVWGEPKASSSHTSEELAAEGFVGVYAENDNE